MAEIQLNNYSISGLYTYTILYRHYTHSDQVQIKQLDIHKIHLYHLSFNKSSKYLQWFTIIAPFTYIFKMQFATQQVYTQIIPHVYYIYIYSNNKTVCCRFIIPKFQPYLLLCCTLQVQSINTLSHAKLYANFHTL